MTMSDGAADVQSGQVDKTSPAASMYLLFVNFIVSCAIHTYK